MLVEVVLWLLKILMSKCRKKLGSHRRPSTLYIKFIFLEKLLLLLACSECAYQFFDWGVLTRVLKTSRYWYKLYRYNIYFNSLHKHFLFLSTTLPPPLAATSEEHNVYFGVAQEFVILLQKTCGKDQKSNFYAFLHKSGTGSQGWTGMKVGSQIPSQHLNEALGMYW